MNEQSRQERQFDQAAEQAHIEGVSSFGRMSGWGWTKTKREAYQSAAKARGVDFAVDQQGIGYFYSEG